MSVAGLDPNTLFEELNRRIDKPIEYNSLIAKILTTFAVQNIHFRNGVHYVHDTTNDKLISTARPILQASSYGLNVTNRYLKFGEVPAASAQGFLIPRDAVVTGLFAKSRSTGAWTIEVRRNGVAVTLVSTSVSGGVGSDMALSVDLTAGDWVQLYANGSAIEHPIAGLEIAWRLTGGP